MTIAHADFIAGLAKGLAVLECFEPTRQRLNASQVAERTGITRAAARRQLLTLEHLGYLEGREGQFWLTPRVLRMAGSYLASARLPRVLQPALDRLAAQTGEAASACVLDGAQVVIVARSLPARRGGAGAGAGAGAGSEASGRPAEQIAHGLHLGARLAAHATSTGRMLLACLPAAELSAWLKQHQPLPALTGRTVTQPRALRRLLEQARADDYSAAHEEHEHGVHALAVPVRNLQGQAVAALNLVVADLRPAAALEERWLPPLRQASSALLPLV